MKTFLKANLASIVATGCDYLLTVLLVQLFDVQKVMASILGTTFGGIVNFLVARNWVFNAGNNGIYLQGRRYLLIWMGNLALNAAGVYWLIHQLGCNYLLAKIMVAVTIAIGYNYPLQKRYVFKITETNEN